MPNSRISSLGLFGGLAVLFLIPCFWLPHIVSADLASHVYNAWLGGQALQGTVTGIEVTNQWNNVLFDLLLTALLPLAGVEWAQRLSVSLAVLVFLTGSLFFIVVVNRRFSWPILPALAMLTYGFVFHAGFFNFYLSAGFCLGALALLWSWTWERAAWAAPLIVLGMVSHPLPVAWLVVVAAFTYLARLIKVHNRPFLSLAMFCAILGLAWLIHRIFICRWYAAQFLLWSGADQAIVHHGGYMLWGLAWLGFLAFLFLMLLLRRGWPRVGKSMLFHLIFLHAAALAVIPSQIQLPGYAAHFSFLSERMSLLQGVLVCALLARVPASLVTVAPGILLGFLYFSSLRADDALIARFEDRVTVATAGLKGLPRVVSGLCTPERHMNYGFHLLDRACIGQCYSYGNYEPSSGQFRLRARPGNGYVVSEISRAYAFAEGGVKVRREELPLLRVEGTPDGEVTVRTLVEGETLGDPCVARR